VPDFAAESHVQPQFAGGISQTSHPLRVAIEGGAPHRPLPHPVRSVWYWIPPLSVTIQASTVLFNAQSLVSFSVV